MEQESTGLKMFQHREQSKSCPQRAAGRQGLRGGGGGGWAERKAELGGKRVTIKETENKETGITLMEIKFILKISKGKIV